MQFDPSKFSDVLAAVAAAHKSRPSGAPGGATAASDAAQQPAQQQLGGHSQLAAVSLACSDGLIAPLPLDAQGAIDFAPVDDRLRCFVGLDLVEPDSLLAHGSHSLRSLPGCRAAPEQDLAPRKRRRSVDETAAVAAMWLPAPMSESPWPLPTLARTASEVAARNLSLLSRLKAGVDAAEAHEDTRAASGRQQQPGASADPVHGALRVLRRFRREASAAPTEAAYTALLDAVCAAAVAACAAGSTAAARTSAAATAAVSLGEALDSMRADGVFPRAATIVRAATQLCTVVAAARLAHSTGSAASGRGSASTATMFHGGSFASSAISRAAATAATAAEASAQRRLDTLRLALLRWVDTDATVVAEPSLVAGLSVTDAAPKPLPAWEELDLTIAVLLCSERPQPPPGLGLAITAGTGSSTAPLTAARVQLAHLAADKLRLLLSPQSAQRDTTINTAHFRAALEPLVPFLVRLVLAGCPQRFPPAGGTAPCVPTVDIHVAIEVAACRCTALATCLDPLDNPVSSVASTVGTSASIQALWESALSLHQIAPVAPGSRAFNQLLRAVATVVNFSGAASARVHPGAAALVALVEAAAAATDAAAVDTDALSIAVLAVADASADAVLPAAVLERVLTYVARLVPLAPNGGAVVVDAVVQVAGVPQLPLVCTALDAVQRALRTHEESVPAYAAAAVPPLRSAITAVMRSRDVPTRCVALVAAMAAAVVARIDQIASSGSGWRTVADSLQLRALALRVVHDVCSTPLSPSDAADLARQLQENYNAPGSDDAARTLDHDVLRILVAPHVPLRDLNDAVRRASATLFVTAAPGSASIDGSALLSAPRAGVARVVDGGLALVLTRGAIADLAATPTFSATVAGQMQRYADTLGAKGAGAALLIPIEEIAAALDAARTHHEGQADAAAGGATTQSRPTQAEIARWVVTMVRHHGATWMRVLAPSALLALRDATTGTPPQSLAAMVTMLKQRCGIAKLSLLSSASDSVSEADAATGVPRMTVADLVDRIAKARTK